MKRTAGRWIMGLLRYGLCALAVWYLVTHVRWNDGVTLNDANHTEVRLLQERASELVILRDGQRQTNGLDQVRRVDGDVPDIQYGIAGVLARIDWWWALLSLVMFAPAPLLQSIRLVWMLGIQDVRLSTWNAIKLSFAGNFFNFALPGTTGGDLIKAYYITRFTKHKTEAVTTVFLDRAVGLLGLVILAGTMIVIVWDPRSFGQYALVLGGVCGGLAFASLFVFSQRLRNAVRLPQLARRLPGGEHLLRIGRTTIAMRRHKGLVLACLANTLVLQAFVLVSSFFMARALGMGGDITRYFIYVPIGFLIAAIPISPPQAFGVLEYAYVQFFYRTGLCASASQPVAFALAMRVVQLVWALPGVLVPLLGAHLPKHAELAALEEPEAVAADGATSVASGAAQPSGPNPAPRVGSNGAPREMLSATTVHGR